MKKVKIYGAGSIGNHLAYASRSMGWDVLICDTDADALKRTKTQIYPSRYGAWDPDIRLCLVQDLPKEDFDIVIIGTPPDSHIELAIRTLKEEHPQILLIEKPLCTPILENAQVLYELASQSDTVVCVGYNHTLGKNTVEAEKILKTVEIGKYVTMNAGFQEHWGGIFKAHPWLSGPQESYLGFSERGGGACGEHSHAINIWQHFAHILNIGRIVEVSAFMDFIEDGKVSYDRICYLNVKTEKEFCGLIIQDVVTEPSKKYLRIQGENGFLEWYVNWDTDSDAVMFQRKGEGVDKRILPKKRPDDFRWEVEHLNHIIEGKTKDSPISLERGLDTMMVISAAHLSYKNKRVMYIDYSKGYILDAIKAL